ncbi:hypothetical protein GOBAR_DD31708 [Gossypium barbadense]|nr:hypothetical protein GOBAR_DD31708 [Gossypium barbadense]
MSYEGCGKQRSSVCWEKPLIGWVKLNTDGGVDAKFGNATVEGFVRGRKGDWVVGYSCNLGVGLVLKAELQAILDGIKIAWDKEGLTSSNQDIRHVLRTTNMETDAASKWARDCAIGVHVFTQPPLVM